MDNNVYGFRGYYRFLSNFYPSEIEYGGIVYPTVEHAYQAQKTLDDNLRYEISILEHAWQAKKMGKRLAGFRLDWDDRIKDDIMLDLVRLKFYTHKDLAIKLINTGDGILYEVNSHGDIYWGTDASLNGDNNLGKTHMLIRDELKNI